MNAIKELEKMGYSFTVDGGQIHYKASGQPIEAVKVAPLLVEIRDNKPAALAYLSQQNPSKDFGELSQPQNRAQTDTEPRPENSSQQPQPQLQPGQSYALAGRVVWPYRCAAGLVLLDDLTARLRDGWDYAYLVTDRGQLHRVAFDLASRQVISSVDVLDRDGELIRVDRYPAQDSGWSLGDLRPCKVETIVIDAGSDWPSQRPA